MTVRPFGYQWEKLSQARSALLPPHPDGLADAFSRSFDAVEKGFRHFDFSTIKEESPLAWIATIKKTMDTSQITTYTGKGKEFARAEQLSFDEQQAYADAVDELAYWFLREYWGVT